MIDRITFVCETCGKTKTLELKELENRPIPVNWMRDEHPQASYSLDWCSGECREKFKRTHPLLLSGGVSQGPHIIPVSMKDISNDLLRSMFSSASQARSEAIVELSKEFGVSPDLVSEFGFHLQNTSCPRCKAGPGEYCKVLEGDETTTCPFHEEEELKGVTHKERLLVAKKTWKSQLQ